MAYHDRNGTLPRLFRPGGMRSILHHVSDWYISFHIGLSVHVKVTYNPTTGFPVRCVDVSGVSANFAFPRLQA